ncbi:hypothetical protein OTK49_00155 [Vibrio coralliirubri]|uniref:hypothetical protein n=1 Tax=Vibrio coralliirubri TaxID=1516159 RepID=UPI002284CEAF|nr:hypothetical protein [Vibrio coralliirubri]MCY9860952.1 hypothetical protein [Vibrio coralliirubri]
MAPNDQSIDINAFKPSKAFLCGMSTTATPLGGLTDKLLDDSIGYLKSNHNGEAFPLLNDYCSLYSLPSFEESCKKHGVKGLVGTTITIEEQGERLGELTFVAKNDKGLNEITNLVSAVNSHKHNLEKIKFTKSDLSLGQWVYKTMHPEDLANISSNVVILSSPSSPELLSKISESNNQHLIALSARIVNGVGFGSTPINEKKSVYLHSSSLSGTSNHKLFRRVLNENKEIPEFLKGSASFEHSNVQSLGGFIEGSSVGATKALTGKLVSVVEDVSVLEKEKMPEALDFGINIHTESWKLLEGYLAENPHLERAKYENYLRKELSIIKELGAEGYYQTIIAFKRYLDENPNVTDDEVSEVLIRIRGSAVGSLVFSLFDVTNALTEAVQNDFLIERFITSARVELPDVDIDIPNDQRHLFVKFMESHFGDNTVVGFVNKNQVSGLGHILRQVSDFHFEGNVPADWKMYIDKLNIQVRFELKRLGFSLDEQNLYVALQYSDVLKKAAASNQVLASLLAISPEYAEWTSTYTTHVSGMLFSPTGNFKLPLRQVANGGYVLEVKKPSKVGFVKFDILSSNNVKFLREASAMMHQFKGQKYTTPTEFPPEFWSYLSSNNTFLNQMGGLSAKETLLKVKPTNTFELALALALPRPVISAEDRAEYYRRRAGSPMPDIEMYRDPRVASILKPSCGFIIFDEQILALAFDVAGFTSKQADTLRTSIKKGNQELFESMNSEFRDGVIANGGSQELAAQLFELLNKSVGRYSFPRAHATSYAAIAMEQAWVKMNHPDISINAALIAFKDSIKTNPKDGEEMTNFDRLLSEYRAMGIKIVSPSINLSMRDKYRTSNRDGVQVIYAPLEPIFKGVRDAQAKVMLDAIGVIREKGLANNITLQKFIDLTAPYFESRMRSEHNFKEQSDILSAYKDVVNRLVYFGAFDETGFSLSVPADEASRIVARSKLLGISQAYMEDVLSEYHAEKSQLMRVKATIDVDNLVQEERKAFKTSFCNEPIIARKDVSLEHDKSPLPAQQVVKQAPATPRMR